MFLLLQPCLACCLPVHETNGKRTLNPNIPDVSPVNVRAGGERDALEGAEAAQGGILQSGKKTPLNPQTKPAGLSVKYWVMYARGLPALLVASS